MHPLLFVALSVNDEIMCCCLAFSEMHVECICSVFDVAVSRLVLLTSGHVQHLAVAGPSIPANVSSYDNYPVSFLSSLTSIISLLEEKL